MIYKNKIGIKIGILNIYIFPKLDSQFGPLKVRVHKWNVLPQNQSQDITLNDHYIYKIIYGVDFFSLDIHIVFN